MNSLDHSQLLANFGPKYCLKIDTMVYRFSYLSDKQRAWYEQWMKFSYLDAIDNDETLSTKRKLEQRDYAYSRIRAGEFRFGAEEFNRVKDTELGKLKFIQMLLMDDHPEITEDEVRELCDKEPQKISVIFSLILVESAAIVTRIKPNKKEQLLQDTYAQLTKPPEAGGLGIPLDIIAELTDKQKQALLTKELSKEGQRPEVTKEMLDVGNAAVDAFLNKVKAKGVAVVDTKSE